MAERTTPDPRPFAAVATAHLMLLAQAARMDDRPLLRISGLLGHLDAELSRRPAEEITRARDLLRQEEDRRAPDPELIAELRAGVTREGRPHLAAAVNLLIEDGFWLAHEEFVAACVFRADGYAVINWDAARLALNGGSIPHSTAQRGVLDAAIALGGNEFHLDLMDDRQRSVLLLAFTTALEPALDPRGSGPSFTG
ncbi:hypothetical protein [Bailinhaonella thermotolerans]|uniref:Uncharacterized protein n=1 Tax=Bailinhaonella thermotolerans TaxID=1070861 RepID=A0A3A4A1R5_9ACTN|nr:hypothetical protein [Bailinhaonella thermotolerans]RJL21094.1 hypothetical protein D5H75_38435 [Bailinhaonella thermotolerans]